MAKHNHIFPFSLILCFLSLLIMLLSLTSTKPSLSFFTPPSFESSVSSGTPVVPADLGYSEIYQDGMGFRAWVCGNVTVRDANAVVYFTNPADNSVWLKLRVYDDKNNIIGETGLLKPGEYVETLKLDTIPDTGSVLKLKIMAYEPETYYSAGAVVLNTVLGNTS